MRPIWILKDLSCGTQAVFLLLLLQSHFLPSFYGMHNYFTMYCCLSFLLIPFFFGCVHVVLFCFVFCSPFGIGFQLIYSVWHLSRFTFVIAFLLLLTGAALNDQHGDESAYFNYYCYVVKPGVFAGGAMFVPCKCGSWYYLLSHLNFGKERWESMGQSFYS